MSPRPSRPGTFRVLERNLPALQRRVERLGRRSERLGTAPLVLRDTGRRDGHHALVELDGEPPALEGWTLAAVVDHRPVRPVIRVVCFAAPPLEPARFDLPHCDHCRLNRRRVETFVVWHAPTGRLRQVGTGCLRDFLGGHDPDRMCRQAEYLLLAQEVLAAAAGPNPAAMPKADGISLERFAAHAAMAVRAHGWVSRDEAARSSRLASTDIALASLESTPDAPGAADRALAKGALLWARELLAAQARLSEFERDAVNVVSGSGLLTRRERGLVCALIAVYRRRRLRSRHLGQIGQWVDGVLVVERIVEQPSSRHGFVSRHDLIDVAANRLVWWQTRGQALPTTHAIHLRGRVERHTHFGGAAITVLSRCRPVDRQWAP